ncbi:MAG: co-chaperone GroES [Pseudobdellovibrionaceae bacterium]
MAKAKKKTKNKPTAKKTIKKTTKIVKAARPKKVARQTKSVPKKKTASPKKTTASKAATKPAAKPTPKTQNLNFENILTPLDDRILAQAVAVSDRTPGGLFIPDTAVIERNNRCRVLAVGRGHTSKKGKLRPLDVQVGDEVLLSSNAGSQVHILGQELYLIRESEVLGVMKK